MSPGITPRSAELYRSTRASFADLFEDVGRRSVPPRIVATLLATGDAQQQTEWRA
jgi:hypothetical protein